MKAIILQDDSVSGYFVLVPGTGYRCTAYTPSDALQAKSNLEEAAQESKAREARIAALFGGIKIEEVS